MLSQAKEPNGSTQEPAIHLILDIDGTISTRSLTEVPGLNDLHCLRFTMHFNSKEQPAFCYLNPGLIELIQFIKKTPNIKLSFFSAGSEPLNKCFLLDLFKAIGETWDENKFPVFSRKHLRFDMKKDLALINADLKNSLLIDDDLNNLVYGQEKNFLYLRPGWNFNPKTKNLKPGSFWEMNNIFLITGILKKGLAAPNHFLNLISSLKADIKDNKDKLISYYFDGVTELQKINPNLNLYEARIGETIKIFEKNTQAVQELENKAIEMVTIPGLALIPPIILPADLDDESNTNPYQFFTIPLHTPKEEQKPIKNNEKKLCGAACTLQ